MSILSIHMNEIAKKLGITIFDVESQAFTADDAKGMPTIHSQISQHNAEIKSQLALYQSLQPKETNPMSRLGMQIKVLEALEPIIYSAGKVVITPTRISIKSEFKPGQLYYNQLAQVNKVVMEQGMLPFTVELVAHG